MTTYTLGDSITLAPGSYESLTLTGAPGERVVIQANGWYLNDPDMGDMTSYGISVFDEAYSSIAYVSESNDGQVSLAFVMPDNGSVTIELNDWNGSPEETPLVLSFASRPADDHADTADGATVLSGSGSLSAAFDVVGDHDWFTVTETMFVGVEDGENGHVIVHQADGTTRDLNDGVLVQAGDMIEVIATGESAGYSIIHLPEASATDLALGSSTTLSLAEGYTAVRLAGGSVVGSVALTAAGAGVIEDQVWLDADGREVAEGDPAAAYMIFGVTGGSADVTLDYQPIGTLGTTEGDTVSLTSGDDVYQGLDGDDLIDGLGGNDVIYANSGNDTLIGGAGYDTLYGGTGHDLLQGDNGHDLLIGSGLSDTLLGGNGNDTLRAGDGGDLLNGGIGNNQIIGGAGNDTIVSGLGVDTISGGEGDDLLSFADATEGVRIYLYGGGSGETQDANGAGTLYFSEIERIETTAFNDRIESDYWDQNGVQIATLDGNDTVRGYFNDSLIETGGGGDRIILTGGTGNQVNAGSGWDRIIDTSDGGSILSGNGGNDRIYGASNDTIYGGGGNDTIYMRGWEGSRAIGGTGKDRIYASEGEDTMQGGAGADTFIFNAQTASNVEKDRLQDFTHGVDKIDLRAFMAGAMFIGDAEFSGDYSEAQLRYVGNKLYGDTDGDGYEDFTLVIVNQATLSQDDFLV